MSTSVSSSKPSRRRRRSNRPLIIVCGILAILLVSSIVLVKGSVSGTEFSPSHFQTRDFSFYEIPYLNLQITPISRSNTTSAVASHLRTSAYIKTPRGKPPADWQLVTIARGPTSTPAVASLLVQALDLKNGTDPFWIGWNKDHPNRAATLWPVVQKLAGRELYILIPELLELARTLPGNDDGTALADVIDQWLPNQYVDLIGDLRQADRQTLADDLLAEALSDYPNSAALAALK